MSAPATVITAPLSIEKFYRFLKEFKSPDDKVTEIAQRILKTQSSLSMEIVVKGREYAHIQISTALTLLDLRATHQSPLQEKLIEILQLDKNIRQINQKFPFFERLQQASEAILRKVSLVELQTLSNTRIFDALVKSEEILQIPVRKLENRKVDVLSMRLEAIRQSVEVMAAEKIWEDPCEMPVAQLLCLKGDKLNAIAKSLPSEAFALLTTDQLRDLDFSKLDNNQLTAALQGPDAIAPPPQKLALLSDLQLNLAARTVPEEISPECFFRLNLLEMSEEQLHDLFCSWRIQKQDHKPRIAMVPAATIQRILPKLSDSCLSLLSEEQILGLDYSQINKPQIAAIWNRETRKTLCHRLSSQSLNQMLLKDFSDILEHISDEQFSHIDVSLIPQVLLNRSFFPPADRESLYPKHTYSEETSPQGQTRHVYRPDDNSGNITLSEVSLKKILAHNKALCLKYYRLLSPEYFAAIRAQLHPGVLAFLAHA